MPESPTITKARKSRRKPKVGGMDRGRPSDIDTVIKRDEAGQPVTVAQAIVAAIREGEFLETAAPRAGIPVKTARGWLRDAGRSRLHTLTNPTHKTTPHERKCLNFAAEYEQACADWEGETLAEHARIARGGSRTVTVRSKRRFLGPDDTEGFVVERIEETRTLPPDARALEWRLAMRVPSRYMPKLAVAPLDETVLTEEEEAASLADALEAFLAGRDEGIAAAAKT